MVGSALEVFWVALRLGLTSFGGPIAHLGYFRQEYVVRRRWLDERSYADVVAMCQFLPGPASSQVGITVGISHAGVVGGFVAWFGFTLPSAIGWRFLPAKVSPKLPAPISSRLRPWVAVTALTVFFGLLIALPLIRQADASQWLAVFDSFFRVGSLVFGGGHVVLPLLQAEVSHQAG